MAAPGQLHMKVKVEEDAATAGEGDHADGHVGDISSTDVFEIAAELSSECAKVGNRFGHDTVAKIVPYVVRLLEELEYSVDRSELLTADLVEAQHEASLAKGERNLEVAFRRKLEEDYQQAFAEWEEKHRQLEAKLNSLQNGADQAKSKGKFTSSFSRPASVDKEDKAELAAALLKLDTLQQELHGKSLEEAKQSAEVEALMQQVKRLASVNQALRRGQQTAKLRSQTLADEKATLVRRVKDLETRLEEVSKKDGPADETVDESVMEKRDESDGGTAECGPVGAGDRSKQLRYTREDMEKVLQERLDYKLRVDEVEEELSDLKESLGLEVDISTLQVASRVATLPRKRKTSRLRGLFENLDEVTKDEGGEVQVIPF